MQISCGVYTEVPRKMLKASGGNWGEGFRSLAEQWECKVEEGHLMPDHVHMLLSVPPKYFINGKSATHIARAYAGRRRNFVGQHFWARGYWVSTVGKNEAAVRLYIQNQEKRRQTPRKTGDDGALSDSRSLKPPALPEADIRTVEKNALEFTKKFATSPT